MLRYSYRAPQKEGARCRTPYKGGIFYTMALSVHGSQTSAAGKGQGCSVQPSVGAVAGIIIHGVSVGLDVGAVCIGIGERREIRDPRYIPGTPGIQSEGNVLGAVAAVDSGGKRAV